jgi:hypothetical protein
VPPDRNSDSGLPLQYSALATISDTTIPAPASSASLRNIKSETPDIGARNTRLGSVTWPTLIDVAKTLQSSLIARLQGLSILIIS